jgi:hypothetical protein
MPLLRERFDAGTGLVALGAVVLLVSLFIDWYDAAGDAWATFELVDIVLAGAAAACLVSLVPRYAGLQRAVPAIAFAALFIVAIQILDPPPVAADDRVETGAWLALAATALMAAGATLSAASISVTVDVRQRDRRRRSAAIDAREREEEEAAAAAEEEAAAQEAPASAEARRARRRAAASEAEPGAEPARDEAALWRGRRPPPDEPAPVADEPRRARRAAATTADDAESGPAPHAADRPAGAEPGADPDRTQALDPVDPPSSREDDS